MVKSVREFVNAIIIAIVVVIVLLTATVGFFVMSKDLENSSQSERIEFVNKKVREKVVSGKSAKGFSKEDLLNDCINHIKKYESFSKSRYYDNDGSATIGYGHHILSGESFGLQITEIEADKLLRSDFNKYILCASKYTDTYSQQLALGMFLYNIGETKFKDSTLRRMIDEGKPIDREIIKWNHFEYNGERRASNKLLRRRNFELSVFNLKA